MSCKAFFPLASGLHRTALDAILARAGAETLQSIATATKGDPKQFMEELARRNPIQPIKEQRPCSNLFGLATNQIRRVQFVSFIGDCFRDHSPQCLLV
jgi:hypothetical protein